MIIVQSLPLVLVFSALGDYDRKTTYENEKMVVKHNCFFCSCVEAGNTNRRKDSLPLTSSLG